MKYTCSVIVTELKDTSKDPIYNQIQWVFRPEEGRLIVVIGEDSMEEVTSLLEKAGHEVEFKRD